MNARDSEPVTMAALPTDHELLQHATAKALTGLYPGPTANASQERERQLLHERVMTRLKHYAPETLQLILTSITPVLRSDICDIILSESHNENYEHQWLHEYIKDVTIVKDTILTTTDQPIHALPLMRGLPHYLSLTTHENPTRRADELTAITRVLIHLLFQGSGVISSSRPSRQYIADPTTRGLLTTHENPNAVATLIIERGTTDPEHIAELLDNMNTTENAVQSGVL